ncbi:MAG: ABC transporter ATP-binding protein [Lachnospiraceae bacterium]|nr:ABC transporter ATP-binding protein [Lachnospiraceae bacterium]
MIEVEHISKTYKVARRSAGLSQAVKALWHRQTEEIRALDDISFTIPDGEMVGYIGPNGAGKSSTIKVLSGVLTPDAGSCRINGRVPWKERKEHVRHIGVVFGQRSGLWWDVPVNDSFELLKEIYRIPDAVYRDSLEELVTLLDLEKIIQTPARQLSLGQRMRCEIAAALLHRPELLFLDEPTIGLDAVSKLAVRDFIRRMNAEHGTTVILTTHDMQDIEVLTKRILLIGHGKILRDCSFEELKAEVLGCGQTAAEQHEATEGRRGAEQDQAAESGSAAEQRKAEDGGYGTEPASGNERSIDEIVAALYAKYQI